MCGFGWRIVAISCLSMRLRSSPRSVAHTAPSKPSKPLCCLAVPGSVPPTSPFVPLASAWAVHHSRLPAHAGVLLAAHVSRGRAGKEGRVGGARGRASLRGSGGVAGLAHELPGSFRCRNTYPSAVPATRFPPPVERGGAAELSEVVAIQGCIRFALVGAPGLTIIHMFFTCPTFHLDTSPSHDLAWAN